MKRTKPPFRADHVGSLLRPAALHEARAKRAKGEIAAEQLKAVEDREIERVIKKQEEVGLQADHRRRVPPLLVASRFPLGPRRRREARHGHRHRVCRGAPRATRASRSPASSAWPGRIRWSSISSSSRRTPGARRRSPSRRRRRSTAARSPTPIDKKAYPTMDGSGTISARPTRRRCAASPMPAAAICSSTRCSSPCCAIRNTATQMTERGDDPEKLGPLYGDLINAAMSDIPVRHDHHHASVPRQLQIDLHGLRRLRGRRPRCCSTGSTCTAISWNTTPSAPAASSRCGWCRRASTVVLGLVTTKTGELESKDVLKRRIEEAAKYHRSRPALPVAAMRLRLDRGGQHADRGRAMGEAAR